MKLERSKASLRCAIYTRVSTENGLEQEFNSLDNQREASEAYIRSQANEGWKLIRDRYDDGGFSGGSMDRPALAKLLDDVRARKVDVIVVYGPRSVSKRRLRPDQGWSGSQNCLLSKREFGMPADGRAALRKSASTDSGNGI
jgi:predicted site-specific integrase-resolvase